MNLDQSTTAFVGKVPTENRAAALLCVLHGFDGDETVQHFVGILDDDGLMTDHLHQLREHLDNDAEINIDTDAVRHAYNLIADLSAYIASDRANLYTENGHSWDTQRREIIVAELIGRTIKIPTSP